LIELWGIAGLIHDLGHGPYSHLYDDKIIKPKEPKHEKRGLDIFTQMISKYKIDIAAPEMAIIMSMVEPTGDEKYQWQYQIVANKQNQIDVDKIDYIQRDCYHVGLKCSGDYSRIIEDVRVGTTEIDGKVQNILCWPSKINFEIFSLFSTRYRLHKQIYSHHAIKGYELLLVPLIRNLLTKEKIAFNDLTDEIVLYKAKEMIKNNFGENDEKDEKDENDEKYEIILRKLQFREQPKLLEEKTMRYDKDKDKIDEWCQKVYDKYRIYENNESFQIVKTVIGFAGGRTPNPLEHVYYYNDNAMNIKKLNPGEQSFMITNVCKEIILRVYQM